MNQTDTAAQGIPLTPAVSKRRELHERFMEDPMGIVAALAAWLQSVAEATTRTRDALDLHHHGGPRCPPHVPPGLPPLTADPEDLTERGLDTLEHYLDHKGRV